MPHMLSLQGNTSRGKGRALRCVVSQATTMYISTKDSARNAKLIILPPYESKDYLSFNSTYRKRHVRQSNGKLKVTTNFDSARPERLSREPKLQAICFEQESSTKSPQLLLCAANQEEGVLSSARDQFGRTLTLDNVKPSDDSPDEEMQGQINLDEKKVKPLRVLKVSNKEVASACRYKKKFLRYQKRSENYDETKKPWVVIETLADTLLDKALQEALSWLLNHPRQTGKIGRWIVRLTSLRFEVVHIPGKDNCIADGLSRMLEEDEIGATREETWDPVPLGILGQMPEIFTSIRLAQKKDPVLGKVCKDLSEGKSVAKFKMQRRLLLTKPSGKWEIFPKDWDEKPAQSSVRRWVEALERLKRTHETLSRRYNRAIIERFLTPVTVQLKELESGRLTRKAHVSQLKPYHGSVELEGGGGECVPFASHREVWLEGVPLDGTMLTLRRVQAEEDRAVRDGTDVKM
uniref:Reverse transcriptase RNase H-like domain-containing protein n=1 Tax=Timema monikensis TaxID=170555 RepID=A0A7R9EDR8_9NEOP|nr:unnamed protein product [Timema monikensis]